MAAVHVVITATIVTTKTGRWPADDREVVFINRCAKCKGWTSFQLAALAVVGDGKGKVGIGYGKRTKCLMPSRKALRTPTNIWSA